MSNGYIPKLETCDEHLKSVIFARTSLVLTRENGRSCERSHPRHRNARSTSLPARSIKQKYRESYSRAADSDAVDDTSRAQELQEETGTSRCEKPE